MVAVMTRPLAMREPTYFVLASLLDGPLHGYAIIKRTGQLSGGRVRLATGTLYTALDRLTADGHVELVREETVARRIRRSYGLTEDGAAALRAAGLRKNAPARPRPEPPRGPRPPAVAPGAPASAPGWAARKPRTA